jgi:hypothetical protein
MSKSDHHWKEVAVENAIKRAEEHLARTEKIVEDRLEMERQSLLQLREAVQTYRSTVPRLVEQLVREQTRELRSEIKELNQQLKKRPLVGKGPDLNITDVKKASTICVFDSLIFAIENWSSDGQVASDVSLCSQSILFPLVYEPVMDGDSDYFIESFPVVSLEIVRRGREFVKWLRETSHSSLADRDTWDAYADVVREWWVNDALPLLYGARSDNWLISSAYDFDKMAKWRDLPASRILEFPLVHDGMELMSKQMDNIREPLGLQRFMQAQIQTRIDL